MTLEQVAATLGALGLKPDAKAQRELDAEAGDHPVYAEQSAAARAMGAEPTLTQGGTGRRSNGPYEVLGVWRKGDVTVTGEQNTQLGVTMPSVLVVEGPDFRAAFNPDAAGAAELAEELVALAAGDTSVKERRDAEKALEAAGFRPDGEPGAYVKGALRITLGLALLALPTFALRVALPLLVVLAPPRWLVDGYKKKVLDAIYGNTAVAPPATIYVALSTTTPTQAGGNVTEPGAGAYARVAMTNNTTNWPGATTADPAVKGNGTAVTFPQATASWGTVTHWVTEETSGTAAPIDVGALTAGQAISNGTTASFAVNALQSTMDG